MSEEDFLFEDGDMNEIQGSVNQEISQRSKSGSGSGSMEGSRSGSQIGWQWQTQPQPPLQPQVPSQQQVPLPQPPQQPPQQQPPLKTQMQQSQQSYGESEYGEESIEESENEETGEIIEHKVRLLELIEKNSKVIPNYNLTWSIENGVDELESEASRLKKKKNAMFITKVGKKVIFLIILALESILYAVGLKKIKGWATATIDELNEKEEEFEDIIEELVEKYFSLSSDVAPELRLLFFLITPLTMQFALEMYTDQVTNQSDKYHHTGMMDQSQPPKEPRKKSNEEDFDYEPPAGRMPPQQRPQFSSQPPKPRPPPQKRERVKQISDIELDEDSNISFSFTRSKNRSNNVKGKGRGRGKRFDMNIMDFDDI